MTQSSIFKEEVEAAKKLQVNINDPEGIVVTESFLLAALQRASMKVVEESVGKGDYCDNHELCEDCCGEHCCDIQLRNTLTTAADITGVKE